MELHEKVTAFERAEQSRLKQLETLRHQVRELELKLDIAKSRTADLELLKYSLQDAAERGDDLCVRRLLKAGHSGQMDSALKLAVEHNCLSTVKILLQAGAEVHVFDEESWEDTTVNRLIRIAAENGNIPIARSLLDAGVQVKGWDTNGHNAVSDATEKKHSQMVAFLMDRGMPEGSSRHGQVSDLMEACEAGDVATVRVMLTHPRQVDLSGTDREGKTALDYALRSGHKTIASILRRTGLHFRYDRKKDEARTDREEHLFGEYR